MPEILENEGYKKRIITKIESGMSLIDAVTSDIVENNMTEATHENDFELFARTSRLRKKLIGLLESVYKERQPDEKVLIVAHG